MILTWLEQAGLPACFNCVSKHHKSTHIIHDDMWWVDTTQDMSLISSWTICDEWTPQEHMSLILSWTYVVSERGEWTPQETCVSYRRRRYVMSKHHKKHSHTVYDNMWWVNTTRDMCLPYRRRRYAVSKHHKHTCLLYRRGRYVVSEHGEWTLQETCVSYRRRRYVMSEHYKKHVSLISSTTISVSKHYKNTCLPHRPRRYVVNNHHSTCLSYHWQQRLSRCQRQVVIGLIEYWMIYSLPLIGYRLFTQLIWGWDYPP
jgi:hypothetical protein